MAREKNKPFTTQDILIVGLGLAFIGKMVFFPSMTREKAIDLLRKAGHVLANTQAALDTLGSDYLIEWAKAKAKNAATFNLNEKVFDTASGKRII